jgi:HAD superfamily hydrolase (TIGR01450 family)
VPAAPSPVPFFDGLVCDLDGVMYRGEEPIEGAAGAIERLRSEGVRVVFCTNNSAPTVAQYRDVLARMGVSTGPEDIVTSAVVAGEALAGRGLTGRRAMVMGGPGLRQSVTEAGLVIDDDLHVSEVDVVAVGLDTSFGYPALRRAALALRGGAHFLATNDDATYPAPGGEEWPGAGAILAAVEAASGRRAEVMGKPHPPMMDAVARRLDGARSIAIVGDRPHTDLRGGAAKGWTTILVTTGVTPADRASAVEPKPDVVLSSIAELGRRGLPGRPIA